MAAEWGVGASTDVDVGFEDCGDGLALYVKVGDGPSCMFASPEDLARLVAAAS